MDGVASRRHHTHGVAPLILLSRPVWRPSSSSCAQGGRPLSSSCVWCGATPRGPHAHGAASLVVLAHGMAPLVFPSHARCGAPRLPLAHIVNAPCSPCAYGVLPPLAVLARTVQPPSSSSHMAWRPSSSPCAHAVAPLVFPSCTRCGATPRLPLMRTLWCEPSWSSHTRCNLPRPHAHGAAPLVILVHTMWSQSSTWDFMHANNASCGCCTYSGQGSRQCHAQQQDRICHCCDP